MQKPDYYVEVSGELLTSKIRPFDAEKDEFLLSPFFNTLQAMRSASENSDDKIETFSKFNRDFLEFLNFIDTEWPFVRRLHELWLSGKHEFLVKQMKDRLPSDIFPLDNNLEYLRGLHQLFLMGFRPVLPKDFFDHTTKLIWSNISDIAAADPNGYVALTDFFHDNGLFEEYESRALRILNSFVDKYPFFITAIGLEGYKEIPDLDKNGITTVSFEDVKWFYLECFETIGEMISVVLAYNNLKYRNDYFAMPVSTFDKIKTLQDFMDMRNKGNKIKFCDFDEVFNKLIQLDTDNGLRNAIGHDSYSYDGVDQCIIYYSSGKNGTGTPDKIYLIEFIQKALKQFYAILILIELLYQTRKAYYVQHSIVPINLDVLKTQKKQKIGRNESCPCGSGEKYKRCCLNLEN